MNTIEQAREVATSLRSKLARIYLSPERMVEAADTIDALLAELTRLKSQEPVAWQYRCKASWVEYWGLWQDCTAEVAANYQRSPELHDWRYEVRPLFLAAGTQPATFNEKNAALWLTKNKQEQFDVLAAGAQTKQVLENLDELSVGDSSFESWYASYVKEGTKGLKQHCRDAYAAGMGDPLVAAVQAQPCKTLCELCVKRGYSECANVAVTTPLPMQAQERKEQP